MADILTPQDAFTLQELARQRDANPLQGALDTTDRMIGTAGNIQDLNTLANAQDQRTMDLGNSAPAPQSGIGLSDIGSAIGRGIDAITPSRDTMRQIFLGLEAGGAAGQGRTPLYLQERQMNLHQQDLAQQRQIRRDALNQQLQAQEESKRQHDMGMIEKIISGPQEGGVKQKMLEQLGLPQSRALAKAMKESDYENFPLYKEYIPQDIQQKFMSGELKPAEISSWIDLSRDAVKADSKERAKATLVQHALDTPEAQRTPFHKQLVEERIAALENKKMDTELKQSQIDKNKRFADEGPPDHSTINQLSKSMHGKPFDATTQAQQQQTMAKYQTMRPEGQMLVTGDTPLGQLGKSQEVRDPVTGKAAPGWMPQSQALKMGYVNIEPSQVPTVNQLNNVDAAMKEILSAGSTLLRKETGSGLFDVPMGMLQVPLVSLFKKYAGDPDAAVLQSAIKRISPSLSRLGGDVGNIAVAEQQMYADSIFSDADTLESFTKKVQSIMAAQTRSRSSMGFVPDEQSYVRRLVIQGKSDQEIKAMLDERKRAQ
jgi:hypothetical protein